MDKGNERKKFPIALTSPRHVPAMVAVTWFGPSIFQHAFGVPRGSLVILSSWPFSFYIRYPSSSTLLATGKDLAVNRRWFLIIFYCSLAGTRTRDGECRARCSNHSPMKRAPPRKRETIYGGHSKHKNCSTLNNNALIIRPLIYLDFQKAFGSVLHKRLTEKLA